MKKIALWALFLNLTLSSACFAESENWCGTYFEEDGRAYLRIAREDFGVGSSACSLENYQDRIQETGEANVALNFTKNRSTVSKWRKFNNHLIEVRGKFQNGYIVSTRFVRDMGR